ncbi:mitogen-activated protein kinase kinase kinase 5-like [Neltuma alba]|uniref:mitogen-activated protein kinase kinase kinase 5-like n=1 Tax=Neltuma alba TaxID=207710 RepID=UPI0010A472F4|nr:mitogen-activated protein kinase kinase kinase 5-like [Prosopis alba]
MEYIPPGSLKKYISERGVLCESLIQNFTVQILSGLVYLHSRRVVHRDIKPDNLLVDSNNIVKLVDFGLAKHLGESVGKHSQLGTPYYASPEVLQKLEYESSREASAADIWSLGCVIIEMFSGKHPWPRLEWQQAFYRVCLKEEHPDIPKELCQDGKDFLQLCFRRTPAERPSAVALLDHPFVKAKTT